MGVTDNAPRDVVVVGGGITGLTAAYHLAEAVGKDARLQVDLIESDDRLGGKIVTVCTIVQDTDTVVGVRLAGIEFNGAGEAIPRIVKLA